jgi:hypothetical protein
MLAPPLVINACAGIVENTEETLAIKPSPKVTLRITFEGPLLGPLTDVILNSFVQIGDTFKS